MNSHKKAALLAWVALSCAHVEPVEPEPRPRRPPPRVVAPPPPPAPPPVVAEPSVKILTDPDGATVLIDGEKVGVTPLRLSKPTGDYVLDLSLSGYKKVSRPLVMRPGSEQSVMEILVNRPPGIGTLRADLRCTGFSSHPGLCAVVPRDAEDELKVPGKSYERYAIALRVRGVMEPHYVDGCRDAKRAGWCQRNDPPEHDGNNVYTLQVVGDDTIYYLNAGSPSAGHPFGVDYRRTIVVAGGSTLRLFATSEDDVQQRNNNGANMTGRPIVVKGVPPDPDPFAGQFVQVDVESMTRTKD